MDGIESADKRPAGLAPLAYRRPALFALGAICAGVILGQSDFLSHWSWLATAILAVAIAGVLLSGGRASDTRFQAGIAFTLLGVLSLLAFRVGYSGAGASRNHVLNIVEDSFHYKIYGFIDDWPDIREHATRLTVRVDSTARVVASGRYGKTTSRTGSIMVYVATQSTDFQYADRIIFEGELRGVPEKKNPGGFDYARFLRWKDIFAMVYLPHHFGIIRDAETGMSIGGFTRVVRAYILSVFRQTLEEQPAALASGFLIGETAGISDEIYRQFRRSGTLHLLAVSGSNVAVALLVLRLFLWPFPVRRKAKYFLLMLGALLFSFISHNDPSVVRASVMVTLFLLGRSFERKIDFHNLIASAGALILIWNPNQLFDVGFQLSFVVTWALIIFIPPANEFFKRHRRTNWYRFLAIPFIVALVAQLSSSPIALYYFGSTPLNATFSNVIIGPAVAIAVALSLATLFAASLLPLLGALVGAALNLWLKAILFALKYFGSADSWQFRISDFSAWYAICALVIVLLFGVSLTVKRMRRVLVFALVLIPLGLFAQRGFSSYQADATVILATRGGICAVIGGSKPAIIVSDLIGAPETQFQYVIAPALRRAGARIGSHGEAQLAQLSADYTTLTNSLTICDSFPRTKFTLTADASRLWLDYQSQYGITSETYQLSFSSELDTVAMLQALQTAPASEQSASLFVGSSLALQISGEVRVLYLSSAVDRGELNSIIRTLSATSSRVTLSQLETPLVVVVDKLEVETTAVLQKLSRALKLKIVSGRRNHRLQLSSDFAQLVSYISETGAVTIISK